MNEQDIDEIPEHLRKDLEFKFVSTVDEVLEAALQRRSAPKRVALQRPSAPKRAAAARSA
jgi:ATP-dependent Lon protease